MGKIYSFINYKGGVGKTTLAVEIASAIAYHINTPVLLIDLDPQTNATLYLMEEKDWEERAENAQTLREVFYKFLKRELVKTDELRYKMVLS